MTYVTYYDRVSMVDRVGVDMIHAQAYAVGIQPWLAARPGGAIVGAECPLWAVTLDTPPWTPLVCPLGMVVFSCRFILIISLLD